MRLLTDGGDGSLPCSDGIVIAAYEAFSRLCEIAKRPSADAARGSLQGMRRIMPSRIGHGWVKTPCPPVGLLDKYSQDFVQQRLVAADVLVEVARIDRMFGQITSLQT